MESPQREGPPKLHYVVLLIESQRLGLFSRLSCTSSQLAVEDNFLVLCWQRLSILGLEVGAGQLKRLSHLSN